MVKILIMIGLVVNLLLTGCARQGPGQPIAGLTPKTADKVQKADLPGGIVEEGSGNFYRIMANESTGRQFLELAAGQDGTIEYFREVNADNTALADFKVQFLSTQGIGRMKIAAIGPRGQVLQTVGWVVTGPLPDSGAAQKWLDSRYDVNYRGHWMEAVYPVRELLSQQLGTDLKVPVVRYRLSVEVGHGQHALIEKLELFSDSSKAVTVTPQVKQVQAKLGDVFVVEAEVTNTSQQTMPDSTIKLVEPYGFGLTVQSAPEQVLENLAPGEKRILSWRVKAQRPDAVNLNKPWPVRFSVNGSPQSGEVQVAVSDPRSGRIFYIMTDDLEPMDSAGYPVAWGNANGWLDPAEFSGQLIQKAEALNTLADQYGAKWTHYIAWPAIKAGEWAATQSTTGEWPKVIANIKQSVAAQSKLGHEYGVHMHSDYDPYLPDNVLSYNQATDGFWANHLRHGWAHSLLEEGDFSQYVSRTGILYHYQRILDELAADSPQGQLITSRVGSFDFGNGPEDEAKSIRAYRKVGLWGSTDADGNAGGLTSGSYGQEIYLTGQDDINAPAQETAKIGLVEFRPTPKQFIGYDNQSAEAMNIKAAEGISAFTNGKSVKPGIHAIVGFTHAMFILGANGWQSTEGGQFKVIEEHLSYLKNQYVDQGVLEFATASTLVAQYLDYYSPLPVALYGKRINHSSWASEYEIKILGRDIPFDALHTHTVSMKYPLYLRDSAFRITVLKNGEPVYNTWGLPTPYNDIEFPVDDAQAHYTLKVYHNDTLHVLVQKIRSIKQKILKKS
jgi:hypothetical protein